MKVLLITAHFPYPLNNGARIRDFNILKRLSEKCEVSLLTFYEFQEQIDCLPILRKYCTEIEAVLRKSDKARLLRNLNIVTNPFFLSRPFHAVNYYSRKFEKVLQRLVDSKKFDIVQIGFLHMAQYIKSIPGEIPVLLDTHNAEHLIMHRYFEAEKNLLKKFYLLYQREKLKRYEKKMCRRFDRCLTVSEKDKAELMYVCDEKASFSVIPNGVDIDYYTPTILSNREAYCTDLIYHGTMSGHMNVDAIIYFYDNILPYIRTKIPDVKLTIAGANPDKKLLNLSKIDKNVVVTGAVDDMRPYVAGSKVVIVPLRIGGGTRLKIPEAMAQEKAVVSTSVGCEGLEVTPDKDIIVADNPKEFANRTVELLKDEGLRLKIGLNGRKLVEAKYDWRIIVEKLYSLYQEVIKVKNSKNYENPLS